MENLNAKKIICFPAVIVAFLNVLFHSICASVSPARILFESEQFNVLNDSEDQKYRQKI